MYFQGTAQNLKSEAFGFEAQKYNDEMIIVAPQLNDWGETSANQTIALVEYFLENYNIDRTKVYANGFSGGGETMSLAVGKRPELFSAYLHVSSQWDGEYEPVVKARLPVYFAIGRNDEYYGAEPTKRAYDTLYSLYEQEGLSDSEIDELLVLDIKEHEYFTQRNVDNEHGGGGLFAYDADIMGWLFDKQRTADTKNELSLIIAPVADGDRSAVSIFEKADFLPHRAPAAFTLKSVEQIEGDTLWLRYLRKEKR